MQETNALNTCHPTLLTSSKISIVTPRTTSGLELNLLLTALWVLPCGCHLVGVALSVPHCRCRLFGVALSVSRCRCRHVGVTLSVLPCRCHLVGAALSVSPCRCCLGGVALLVLPCWCCLAPAARPPFPVGQPLLRRLHLNSSGLLGSNPTHILKPIST